MVIIADGLLFVKLKLLGGLLVNIPKRELKVAVNISVPESYARCLRYMSGRSGLAVSELARRGLEDYFEKVGVSPEDYKVEREEDGGE